MDFQITHIGIKQDRQNGFRYKRLHNSGIFRGNDTRQKLIDCQGPFEEWTNISARKWIFARVKEQKEGRKVHIVCDCCDVIEEQGNDYKKLSDINLTTRKNKNCYGDEIVVLIKSLAKQN